MLFIITEGSESARGCDAGGARQRCYDENIERILCKICELRRPRRTCPGVHGDICAICCGTEREQTVHCPLDCEYLWEARKHEPEREIQPGDIPNMDIRVTEEFLREHEALAVWFIVDLLKVSLATSEAVDNDAKDALAALIKTYRTLQSGLVYETRPVNPIAGAIYDGMIESVEEYRRRSKEDTGMQTLRDVEVLGMFVFLERMLIKHENGRRLGRAFIHYLTVTFPQPDAAPEAPTSLLV